MKYYFIQTITQVDGLEFIQSMVIQNQNTVTYNEAEDIALGYLGHEDSGEVFKLFRLEEITKLEMNILNKYL